MYNLISSFDQRCDRYKQEREIDLYNIYVRWKRYHVIMGSRTHMIKYINYKMEEPIIWALPLPHLFKFVLLAAEGDAIVNYCLLCTQFV